MQLAYCGGMTPETVIDGRRILVVEDDPVVSEVLVDYLRHDGMSVNAVHDGFAALGELATSRADVVILDRMLPGIDGVQICERIRATNSVPILLLTALGSEDDRIAGLVAGADDYLVKPFSPREVVLRVRALLRRSLTTTAPEPDAVVGGLSLDGGRRIITQHGQALDLTTREFDLLAFLLRHPDQVFDRSALLQHVWGWNVGDESTVTVHMRRLREKVEPDPAHPRILRTLWGAGYYLADAPEREVER